MYVPHTVKTYHDNVVDISYLKIAADRLKLDEAEDEQQILDNVNLILAQSQIFTNNVNKDKIGVHNYFDRE